MRNNRAIVWFQKDLRIHDNEALIEAASNAKEVIPVYVFDDRELNNHTDILNIEKTGSFRSRFLIESVDDLRVNLRSRGSDLIVRTGISEDVLFELAKQFDVDAIYCNRERTREEVFRQESLEKLLWSIGREVRYSRGKMLYYTADLPFPITHAPDNFLQFRKEVERFVNVRLPLEEVPIPSFTSKAGFEIGDLPTMSGAPNLVTGGESAALTMLSELTSKANDNELTLVESKRSLEHLMIYLSDGCLSPKTLYHTVSAWSKTKNNKQAMEFAINALLWRDFYRLMGKKYRELIFEAGGVKGRVNPKMTQEITLFNIWKEGRTGVPFVDACMNKLNSLGYLYIHERRLIASFLVFYLKLDWRMGAEYFENMLINYDPCSVWGFWNYITGISSDDKDGVEVNCLRESAKYDPEGTFVKQWVPALKDIPDKYVHKPFVLSEEQLLAYNVRLGADYPAPAISSVRLSC